MRVMTCGAVDDGKSTLMGRLLLEEGAVFADQLAAATRDSQKYGTLGDRIDPALLLDGLEDERQQGITIDVAYRYVATPRRSFIIADAPGHEQYTRNMATAASTADLVILLVDATKGLLAQTRRHAAIAGLFGVRHVVLAVNKMDLVGFSEAVFAALVAAFARDAGALNFASVVAVPLCARDGDMVATRGARLPWYDGPTLIESLEACDIASAAPDRPLRLPVQWVNRPNADFRGYSGTLAGGRLRRGDPIMVAGSGRASRVARLIGPDGDVEAAEAGDAVTITLADEIDISRGDLLCGPKDRPDVAQSFTARMIWLDEAPALVGLSYLMKIGGRLVPAVITQMARLDVTTLAATPSTELRLNELGLCHLTSAVPVAFDPYAKNPRTGAFILIDRLSNATAACGMIVETLRRATNVHPQDVALDAVERAALKRQRPAALWFTGLPGAGKSTVANLVEARLHARGCHTMLLDGDNLRHGLNRDLGFTAVDRAENIRRAGEVAKLMTEAGLLVLCCFISPFAAERERVRALFKDNFIEVFVDTPLAECIARDPKGLYKRALAGEIADFTGVGQPYERPERPEIVIGRSGETAAGAADRIVALLVAGGFVDPA